MSTERRPLVIGAGPAGLTAALELARRGVTPRLYEASGRVGGLACTPTDGDWRVDPGGHRFFTRSEEVLDLWKSLLPPRQWHSIARRSATLVDGRYVRYPLIGRDLMTQMGRLRGLRGLTSLAWARLRCGLDPRDDDVSFRDWGTREFGRYWYGVFFEGYVRKTWLTEPDQMSSDWADQRIKPINWWLRRKPSLENQDVFRYPRLGPGQLWEAAADVLAQAGVTAALHAQVDSIRADTAGWTIGFANGHTASGDSLFSSMPLRRLIEVLEPAPPAHIRAAAGALKHRGLITVAVALRRHYDIPYNWVYTPGPGLRAGRIQNYTHWSKDLAPPGWTGTHLGLEYFVGPDSDLWATDDASLEGMAMADLDALGLDAGVLDHVMVVRSRFAYPVCDPGRERSIAWIRDFLRREHPALYPIGRNGMHHYDNQDHAMLSAMHSVARYFGEYVDPWQVNTDRRYHESGLLKG